MNKKTIICIIVHDHNLIFHQSNVFNIFLGNLDYQIQTNVFLGKQ